LRVLSSAKVTIRNRNRVGFPFSDSRRGLRVSEPAASEPPSRSPRSPTLRCIIIAVSFSKPFSAICGGPPKGRPPSSTHPPRHALSFILPMFSNILLPHLARPVVHTLLPNPLCTFSCSCSCSCSCRRRRRRHCASSHPTSPIRFLLNYPTQALSTSEPIIHVAAAEDNPAKAACGAPPPPLAIRFLASHFPRASTCTTRLWRRLRFAYPPLSPAVHGVAFACIL
jgi:hypothetical protein